MKITESPAPNLVSTSMLPKPSMQLLEDKGVECECYGGDVIPVCQMRMLG